MSVYHQNQSEAQSFMVRELCSVALKLVNICKLDKMITRIFDRINFWYKFDSK